MSLCARPFSRHALEPLIAWVGASDQLPMCGVGALEVLRGRGTDRVCAEGPGCSFVLCQLVTAADPLERRVRR